MLRTGVGAVLLAACSSYAYWTPAKSAHQWGVLDFGGGGFVTGINASPTNALYARTDVGGGYKLNRSTMTWTALTDWAPDSMPGLFQMASIGFDVRPSYKSSVYFLTGSTAVWGDDRLLISRDEGTTFETYRIKPPYIVNAPGDTTKFDISGNGTLRRRGDRVVVTGSGKYLVGGDGSPLYFTKTPSVPTSWAVVSDLYGRLGTRKKSGISFIAIDTAATTDIIYVGITAGVSTGNVIYRSTDDGVTWVALTSPTYTDAMFGANYAAAKTNRGNILPMRGLVSRNGTLYVTLGDANGTSGAVWKLSRGAATFVDATPLNTAFKLTSGASKHFVPYCGMDLLSGSTSAKDTVVVGTFGQTDPQRWVGGSITNTPGGDNIFTTITSGTKWLAQFSTKGANPSDAYTVLTQAQFDATITNTPDWLERKPLHWASGVAIDRQMRTRVLSGSGNGIWGTDNMDWGFVADPTITIKDAGATRSVRWSYRGQGVQELVPYGLMFGQSDVKVAGFLDYGAFQWTDPALLTKRLSTGASSNTELVNAPNNLKVMARIVESGWVYVSQDNGVTWVKIPEAPFTGTASAGRALLLSADGKTLYLRAPDKTWWRTTDLAAGTGWTLVQPATTTYAGFVVDSKLPAVVYSFNKGTGVLSRSTDYGSTFKDLDMTGKLPGAWATVYGATLPKKPSTSNYLGSIVASPDRSGDLWINTSFVSMGGMWRIRNAHTDNFTVEKLGQGTLDSTCKANAYYSFACPSMRDSQVIAAQIWVGAPKLLGGEPSVYVRGWLTSAGGPTQPQGNTGGYIWGLFRSNDGGKTWEDIQDSKHLYGGFGNAGMLWVSPTKYGEFYQSTAGRGIAWARPANTAPTMSLGANWISAADHTQGFRLYANTISDAENNISRVDYYVNGLKVGTSSVAPQYSFNFTNVAWNTNYTVKAHAYDALGLQGVSNTFTITNPYSYGLKFSGRTTWYGGLYVDYTLPANFTTGTMQLLNANSVILKTLPVAAGSVQQRFIGVYPLPAGTYIVRLVEGTTVRASGTVSKIAY